jgi:hypothetical protein
MNEAVCIAAKGTIGCKTTRLLRLTSNSVYLSPKNFELFSFEYEIMLSNMYMIFSLSKEHNSKLFGEWHTILERCLRN